MTMIRGTAKTCAVCGTRDTYQEIMSTNTFGAPDLDLRPAEMARSTISCWVKKCPVCGYAASDITKKTSVSREWLKSEKYQNCNGIEFESELAKRFYQQYMICKEEENEKDAFYAILHAAWACDDVRDKENAITCRKTAADLAENLIELDAEETATLKVVRIDLLRRAGEFEKVKEIYPGVAFGDDLLDKILKFEIEKAEAGDDRCYTVADVTGEK